MYLIENQFVYSPSDLTLFQESPFASWMEHYARCYPDQAPQRDDDEPMQALLQQKGDAHEHAVLAAFRADGLQVVDASQAEDKEAKQAATLAALQQGAEVVFQAALQKGAFQGYADFLIRVPGASALGDYHYEVWDTKLASSVKPHFTVQLCCYQEMLAELQGRVADDFVVVLGNGERARLPSRDYYHYYLALKSAFLQMHDRFDPARRPDPADSVSWGRWSDYAQQLFVETDHLNQVANITHGQIKKLMAAGIGSAQVLAESGETSVSGFTAPVFQRLRAQARIQKASQGKDKPLYEVLAPVANASQGLALLPPHSDLDVFFDIEGYPLQEGGLEYLWGSTYFDERGERQFRDFWAHDAEQEKRAFCEFIDWVYGRWRQDPGMHIYHYASYEISACRKLMSRHGVREHEVDQLLRNEVFVDLYKIVRNGLLIGEPRYSIKNVEHLYRGSRATEVGSGGDSVVVYEQWREQPDGADWQNSSILNSIRDYNIDDCNSTQELVAWLRDRQREQSIEFSGHSKVVEADVPDEISARIELRERLLQQAETQRATDASLATLTETLAWTLEFHRRESKPMFWRLFDRLGLTDSELLDDLDCLVGCQRSEREAFKPTPRARHLAYEYRYDPDQECKLSAKNYYVLGLEDDAGNRVKVKLCREDSDPREGILVVQAKTEPPVTMTLVPDEYVNPKPIPDAIEAVVRRYESEGVETTALLDFLCRKAPRINGLSAGAPITTAKDSRQKLQQIVAAALNLDGSYLPIQGPPGAGKTYTGKHIIAELLKCGKTIGISSNSHKAINNLLIGTARYCREKEIQAGFFCTKNTDDALAELGVSVIQNADIHGHLSKSRPCVVGTTAWGFAREELAGRFDYLFIDEAGQVAIANLIGMSRAARNLILMGDQMQLGQPAQGTHPGESGLSILDYLLHEQPTIADDMGVFLGTTYRMHPAVNGFISEAIYAGQLTVDADNDRQEIEVPADSEGRITAPAGILYLPVHHEGNTQASEEEVAAIVAATRELLGRRFTGKDGRRRAIGYSDILYVAPYNFQVSKLRAALAAEAPPGADIRVGSVDKFQGQEAPVVFLSMCTSEASDSPRGMDFLFDRQRINVAISRAQCLAVVVANPALQLASADSLKQQRQANLFCALLNHARTSDDL